MNLQICLLGQFRVESQGTVWHLESSRHILLLAFLSLHPDAPRARLAGLLWPDSTEEQARTNLRNLLYHLKKACPQLAALLELDGQSIRWKSAATLEVDVHRFRAALTAARSAADGAARLCHLQQAVDWYHGELLPGFYEDWVLTEREELHQAYLNALTQLAKLYEETRQYPEAIESLNRFLRADPLNEAAYAHSMRLHALNDDRAGALQVYHTCVNVLERELGLAPSPELKTLYEQLMRAAEAPALPVEKPAETIRLVGRRPEWAQMKEAWQEIHKGETRFVALIGESGIGKTRLAEELRLWVERQGWPTAWARAYPAEGELGYGVVTQWLSGLPLTSLPDVWKSEVSRLRPELLPAGMTPPGPLTELWQQQRFHEGLARAILTTQPLLLVLDDAQWADRKSLEWLRYLARFDARSRLLVLLTARAEDLTAESPLGALLAALRQEGQLTELRLPRFDVSETRLLAEQVTRLRLSDDDAARLQSETEGLPLFVVELTRAGLPAASVSSASLPDRLQTALTERLSTLTPAARAAAESAAVIGRAFSASLLARAASLEEPGLLAALDELWQRHILREAESGRYDFSHDKLREYIYNALTPARRQTLHRRVAQALTDLEPDDLWGRAGHLEKSGELRQAAEAYAQAAKREAEQASYPAARDGYARALGLMGKQFTPRRVEILLALAKVCYVTGDQDSGAPIIAEALQATAAIEDKLLRFQTLTAAAEAAFKSGRMDEARAWFDMAQPLAAQLGDKTHEINLLLLMADMETRAGQAHRARDLYEQSLNLARQIQSHSLQAEALEGLGFILPAVGAPLQQAGKYLQDAAHLYRLMGDRYREARVLGSMIGYLHAAGEYEEALKLAPEVYAKDQALNYRRGAAIVESSQGLAAYELGQFAQARALLDHARRECLEIGEPDGYGLYTGSLGLVAMAEGNYDEAESLLKEAIDIAEKNQTVIFAAFAQQDLATLYCLQERWQDARPYIEKALAANLENNDNLGILYDKTLLGLIHHHTGDEAQANRLADEVMAKFRVETFEEGGVIRWLWQFKNLLEALGRKEEAAQVLGKAREALCEAAGKIKDENLRRSFLENFAHHRALMEK